MFEILMLTTFFAISLSQLLNKTNGKCPPHRSRLNNTRQTPGKSVTVPRSKELQPRNHRHMTNQTGHLNSAMTN
jgi:hypothetical protein